MAHISVSPPGNSDTFTPLSKNYDRSSKDGNIPVINFLIGSHYNGRIGGETSVSAIGPMADDTAKAISGKLEIAGKSTDATVAEKIVAFNSFVYFFPGIRIVGHMELEDDTGATQRIRYEFEDLATNDIIRIDFEAGGSNPQIVFTEVVDGTPTILVTTQVTVDVKNMFFELDFLEGGITKFHIKEPSGTKTRIFNGTLNVDIAEAKLTCRLMTTIATVKTIKSDFVWIFYPTAFIGYDVALADRLKGRIKVFDTDNKSIEADWIEVRSGDHEFSGERVVENGLIRLRFRPTPEMEIWGWDGSAWASIGSVTPVNTDKDVATVLQDVILQRFSNAQAKIIAKYGIVDHIIDLRRGNPYVYISANSKQMRVDITKARVALSTDVDTDIPDFNQEKTDDTNRGNPLDLSPTNNPFVFTNNSNVNTGLLKLDDNWISWYDLIADDTIGWMGFGMRPTSMIFTATSSTVMDKLEIGFSKAARVGIGVLTTTPSALIGGIPTPFNIGTLDTYVKWRANEAVINFNQRMFLRKKR